MATRKIDVDWHSRPSNVGTLATETSITSYPFLTPPYTPTDDRPVPFKSPESDTTSLSQKRRHHPIHSLSERMLDHDLTGYCHTAPIGKGSPRVPAFTRSKSLPYVPSRNLSLYKGSLRTMMQTVSKHKNRTARQRRWTLPTKAASTQGLSTFHPDLKVNGNRRKRNPKPSPAVITLRRATDNLNQGTGITFFPPPKFKRSGTSFLFSFLNTMIGDVPSPRDIDVFTPSTDQGSRMTSTAIIHGNLNSVIAANPASPTITKVDLEPSVSLPTLDPDPVRPRRCSTKYETASSIYEVIWDENDTPSSPGSSPRPRTVTVPQVRRDSAAVTQLETSLSKGTSQSRRQSTVRMYGGLDEFSLTAAQTNLSQDAINASFSRFINESALQNLPRSTASKTSRDNIMSVPPPRQSCLAIDKPTLTCKDTKIFHSIASGIHRNSPFRTKASSITNADGDGSDSESTCCYGIAPTYEATPAGHDSTYGGAAKDTWLARGHKDRSEDKVPLLGSSFWEEHDRW